MEKTELVKRGNRFCEKGKLGNGRKGNGKKGNGKLGNGQKLKRKKGKLEIREIETVSLHQASYTCWK